MTLKYWVFRYLVIGPLLWARYKIVVTGQKNVPQKGAFILAANHQAVIDSFVVSAVVRRQVTFLAKSDYFTRPGFIGWLMKHFFLIGALPVFRGSRTAGETTTNSMLAVLKSGGIIGIHPEGTRAPGPQVHQGKRSLIEVAWKTGVPIIPIALLGTLRPYASRRWWKLSRQTITVAIGEPMTFKVPRTLSLPDGTPPLLAQSLRPLIDRIQKLHVQRVQKTQTRRLMKTIARLGGLQYLDKDAAAVKAAALKASKPQ